MLIAPLARVVALLASVVLFVFVGAGASALAATVQGPEFAPDVRLSQLHVTRSERGMTTVIHWKGPNRYRSVQRVDLDPRDDLYVADVAGSTLSFGEGLPGAVRDLQVSRNAQQVTPDGWSSLDAELMHWAWPFIARVRSGTITLDRVTVGGRALLRGTIPLAANQCAGYGVGTRTIHLDPRTLVPVRILERRGRTVDLNATITSRRAQASDFARLRVVSRQSVRDEKYVRQTLAQANATATWPIAMPTALPAGFTMAALGTAPQGGYLGPEGSFPRSRGVFFAKWTYGLEVLDLTIRPARSTLTRDWDLSDPFGGECTTSTDSEVMVGPITAKYAQGENGSPRLWWRDGTTLYTLSGPFSAEQLATVARSLAPVTA